MAGALLLALLGGVLAAPAHGGHHRLGILVTAVTDEETHRYFMMAQLDDVKIAHYSSDTREVRPAQAWVAQAVGAEYVKEKTQEFLRHDLGSKVETKWWMQLHNQTGGIHTEQVHVSCALSGQAARDLRYQYAYDGRDFISFDHQTGTWVAAAPLAFIQKQRWETGRTYTQYVQRFLQHECLGTLRSLMQQGKVVLEQQGPPVVSVSRRDAPDGSVSLSCRARGFYPPPIHLSWVRGGGDVLAETGSSGILPNADGTYYTQSSLETSPQEDGPRYACRVEHTSLLEPALIWAPGKKGPLPRWILAAIGLVALGLAGAVGVGVWLWRRKSAGPLKPIYTPAATKTGDDSASSSSSGAECQSVGTRR
ncbi:major histocompatibility complex class I-related protein 1-like isoform X1 [Carettochelys insculpta]|uniref:major histocompatibility complex class I-related protein 1-like isoform X1 n=1 Tax=Carettochelys insculpta TaxID=44489 RepID=UPI003EBDF2C9